jgi:hypothetical protein
MIARSAGLRGDLPANNAVLQGTAISSPPYDIAGGLETALLF